MDNNIKQSHAHYNVSRKNKIHKAVVEKKEAIKLEVSGTHYTNVLTPKEKVIILVITIAILVFICGVMMVFCLLILLAS